MLREIFLCLGGKPLSRPALHESELRKWAAGNQNLEYFNVQLLGLSGISNPAVLNITDSRDDYKLRAHLKFLVSDMRNSSENVEETLNVVSVEHQDVPYILAECPFYLFRTLHVSFQHPWLPELHRISCDKCFAVCNSRVQLLKVL